MLHRVARLVPSWGVLDDVRPLPRTVWWEGDGVVSVATTRSFYRSRVFLPAWSACLPLFFRSLPVFLLSRARWVVLNLASLSVGVLIVWGCRLVTEWLGRLG